jgi:hypothetical protein
MDHGQEALRGFAKILLVLPKLQKEKDDLSYLCPMAIRDTPHFWRAGTKSM